MLNYAGLEIFDCFGSQFLGFLTFFEEVLWFLQQQYDEFFIKLIKPRTCTFYDPGIPFQPYFIDIKGLWSKTIKNVAILLTDPLPRLHKP